MNKIFGDIKVRDSTGIMEKEVKDLSSGFQITFMTIVNMNETKGIVGKFHL
jgi:hypothetical protein